MDKKSLFFGGTGTHPLRPPRTILKHGFHVDFIAFHFRPAADGPAPPNRKADTELDT
jgi:hypothetical protein